MENFSNLQDPHTTSDGIKVTVGLRVHDYNWKWGVVTAEGIDSEWFDGWYRIALDDGGTSLMDGTRLSVKGWT